MTSNGKNRPVGRPRKTETIKERSIYVYLPSKVMVAEWKSLAKENRQSISRFVLERVEGSLRSNGEGARYSRKDLIDRNQTLEEENRALRRDLEIKSKAYGALEKELQVLRIQPFLNPLIESVREIHQDMVKLFRTRKRVKYDELLPGLGVKPTELEVVKGINNQIEVLTKFGLIKPDMHGWRWVD